LGPQETERRSLAREIHTRGEDSPEDGAGILNLFLVNALYRTLHKPYRYCHRGYDISPILTKQLKRSPQFSKVPDEPIAYFRFHTRVFVSPLKVLGTTVLRTLDLKGA